MQLFLLNKPVIIKGKLHKKSGLQESQKISCMTRFLFVLIQNIHPANSDKKVLLMEIFDFWKVFLKNISFTHRQLFGILLASRA